MKLLPCQDLLFLFTGETKRPAAPAERGRLSAQIGTSATSQGIANTASGPELKDLQLSGRAGQVLEALLWRRGGVPAKGAQSTGGQVRLLSVEWSDRDRGCGSSTL